MSALFFGYVRFIRRAPILVVTVCLCLMIALFGLWYDQQPFNLVKEAEHARAYETEMLRKDHARDLTAPAGAQ